MIKSKEEHYSLLTSTAIIQKQIGFIVLQGKDSRDFINRLSTNDLTRLDYFKCCKTILTTEKGKIKDVVTVINLDDKLLLAVDYEFHEGVRNWFEKFIVLEDVHINNLTSEYLCLKLLGPHAESMMADLYGVTPDIASGMIARISLDQEVAYVHYDDLWTIPVLNIYGPRDIIVKIRSNCISSSNMLHILDDNTFEMLRIEQGVPLYGKEITEQINPLEAGLEKYVSFTKGCYIGQEVIARLDTYKKLQRKLTGFAFKNKVNKTFKPGKLYLSDDEVGWTTSHTWSFKLHQHIALGYLRTHINSDYVIYRDLESEFSVSVRISKLPF